MTMGRLHVDNDLLRLLLGLRQDVRVAGVARDAQQDAWVFTLRGPLVPDGDLRGEVKTRTDDDGIEWFTTDLRAS